VSSWKTIPNGNGYLFPLNVITALEKAMEQTRPVQTTRAHTAPQPMPRAPASSGINVTHHPMAMTKSPKEIQQQIIILLSRKETMNLINPHPIVQNEIAILKKASVYIYGSY
jgi:hypothetical protein